MTNWNWRIGILNSIGYAAWQGNAYDAVRRITHIMVGPRGEIGFMKSILCVMKDGIEIPGNSIVLHGEEVGEDMAKDLERLWGSNLIQPINGHPRIKLT